MNYIQMNWIEFYEKVKSFWMLFENLKNWNIISKRKIFETKWELYNWNVI